MEAEEAEREELGEEVVSGRRRDDVDPGAGSDEEWNATEEEGDKLIIF